MGRLLDLRAARASNNAKRASSEVARLHAKAKRTRGAFAGAQVGRLHDWVFATTESADQALQGDFAALKARSREMVRNNGHARRFVGLNANNVVGHRGIRLQATLTTGVRQPQPLEDLNALIEREFEEWAEPESCTVDGRLSWVGVQRQVAKTEPADGEYLVRLVPGFRNPWGFSLQVLDTDLLDHTLNRAPGAGVNAIRMGVEIDRWGRPVAYWVWTRHPYESLPGSTERHRERIPAEQIVHGFDPIFTGQTRGFPWFVATLVDAHNLAGFRGAAVIAARIGAAQLGFFEDKGIGGEEDPSNFANDDGSEEGEREERITMEAEPGLFRQLPRGLEFKPFAPTFPSAAYEPFVTSNLHDQAAGLEVSYALLTGDLRQANYGSQRGGALNDRDVWRARQVLLATHLHRRVFREWLKWAVTMGRLPLEALDALRPGAVCWQPRGWAWIDPKNDQDATVKGVAAATTSLTQAAAEQGRDIEDVFRERARENALAKKYGVELNFGLPSAPAGKASQDDDDQDAEDDAPRLAAV